MDPEICTLFHIIYLTFNPTCIKYICKVKAITVILYNIMKYHRENIYLPLNTNHLSMPSTNSPEIYIKGRRERESCARAKLLKNKIYK